MEIQDTPDLGPNVLFQATGFNSKDQMATTLQAQTLIGTSLQVMKLQYLALALHLRLWAHMLTVLYFSS